MKRCSRSALVSPITDKNKILITFGHWHSITKLTPFSVLVEYEQILR
jgi:hypothetical protein